MRCLTVLFCVAGLVQSVPPTKSQTADRDAVLSSYSNLRRTGLKYQIIYKTYEGDTPKTAQPSRTFNRGELVKIQIESNIDGYLYIWMQGSSGAERLLFPDPKINQGRNRVTTWQRVTIPQNGWFEVAGKPGLDVYTLIVTRSPLVPDREDTDKFIALQAPPTPSENRDFVFVPEDKAADESHPDQKVHSMVVVNMNAVLSDSVTAKISVKHR